MHVKLLQGVPVITLLAVPLPILTAVLWRGSESLFGPPQEGLSLEAAAALDRRDQVCPKNIVHAVAI